MSDIPFLDQLGEVFELAVVDHVWAPAPAAPKRWRRLTRTRVAALTSVGVLAAGGAAVAAGLDPWSLIASSPPIQLFRSNPAWWNQDNTPNSNTAIIASSVKDLGSVEIPHVGRFEYWGAQTTAGTYCEAFKGSDGLWAGTGNAEKDYNFGGPVPGCGITTTFPGSGNGAFSWTNDWIGPVMPNSSSFSPSQVEQAYPEQSHEVSVLVYGTEDFPGATTVLNPTTGVSGPVLDGTYFALVLPPGSTDGSNIDLEALNSSGTIIGRTVYTSHD